MKIRPALIAFFLLSILNTQNPAFGSGKDQPSGLSVNFLQYTGQVLLNGYLVPTPLDQAVRQNENFQFTEISSSQPYFGWIVNSSKKNVLQKAYRILVASNPEDLNEEKNLLWDSGKTENDNSVNIRYAGQKLEPNQVYYWKVKTWDNENEESSFSSPASFKTASVLSDTSTDRYPLQKQDVFPLSVRTISPSCSFIDFGRAAFGRLRLTLNGSLGKDSIFVRLGEVQMDGRVLRNPGGTIRFSEYKILLKTGINTYILAVPPDKMNTAPRAILMPKYTGEVTPFRYCEIEGYKGGINKEQVVQEVVSYPFNDNASFFTSSDTVLNKVWELCKYSVKATSFTGIYIDGDRERIPYEADAYINQLCHYGVDRDFSMARYSHEYLITHPTWPTEWILQSVLMAWNDYLYTGNPESLRRFYPDLKAKTLLALADESGFISTTNGRVTPEILESIHFTGKLRDIVDWPQPGAVGVDKKAVGEIDGYQLKDINTVVNAFHFKALQVMGQIAGVLDQKADEDRFIAQSLKLKKSFNEKLFDKKRGIYVDGIGTDHASLHANMFPLAFGLVPEKFLTSVTSFIRSRGMACGVYGSQFLMDALYGSNNGDYALSLLSSTDLRSWYNMIRLGSTITLEAWDNQFKPNLDWNHIWGAVPANVIPRKLMGIEPLEPGFKKIQIKPQPGSLRHAEIKCPTIRGDVLVSFRNDPGNSFQLKISTPANTLADVYLPNLSKSPKITCNGSPVVYEKSGQFILIRGVGSGESAFEILK